MDSIEGSNLPSATVGSKLVYEDTPPFHAADGRPVRLNYAAVTEGLAARGDMSNIATIVPIDVPVPPDALTAASKPEGIVLTWKAPEKAVAGNEKPRVAGYNIYRTAPNQAVEELSSPINPAPVAKTTYTDVPAYGTYQYVVTAVATTSPKIESDPSAPATAQFKDLLPPPTPTGLTALVETNAVRLVWDPVDAPDLAGYRIWRTEGSGIQELKPVGKIPLTPDRLLTTTNFTDPGVQHGISYFYEVSSVDKSGNESKPAKTDWVLVPKTP
jgi:predicted phage tail protein